MKSTRIECGSIEWAQLHVGVVSAGEFDALMSPEMKPRTGEGPKTFLYKKAAEVFRGQPMCTLSPSAHASWQMNQGIILEEEAIPWYSLTFGQKVTQFLFCTTDDGLAGCTPDGLVEDDGGLEIKSPEPHTHVKYLLDGILPKDYRAQVQFSLYVTGRKWWRFVSWRRRFPPLMIQVERDEEIMESIDAVVKDFHFKLNEAVAKLKSLK